MRLSVIIVTFERVVDLRAALDSVVQQKTLPDEVIVVDQSESPGTKNLLEEFSTAHSSRGLRFIYTHQSEKSIVKARNTGLGLCTGEIISFLDDDVTLFEDYYKKVLHCFCADPGLGGLSGQIVNLERFQGWKWRLRKILSRLFLINNFDGKMTPSGFGYAIFDRPLTTPTEVELIHGCDMNFRAAAIKDKKFDEWFSGYSYRKMPIFPLGYPGISSY